MLTIHNHPVLFRHNFVSMYLFIFLFECWKRGHFTCIKEKPQQMKLFLVLITYYDTELADQNSNLGKKIIVIAIAYSIFTKYRPVLNAFL